MSLQAPQGKWEEAAWLQAYQGTEVRPGWLEGGRGSLECVHGAERRICRNFGKFAPISDFDRTVRCVDGVELTQGPHWSETAPRAVPGVNGDMCTVRYGTLITVLYIC